MPQLIGQLQQDGISVWIRDRQTGEIKGISYKLNGIAFSGTHLGKAYTFTGSLQTSAQQSKRMPEPPQIQCDRYP